MENHNCFTQLPDAKVKVAGIREIKDYLKRVVPNYTGNPVVNFTTVSSEVFVHILNIEKGHTQKKFFGHIEDIALNIQRGFYEEAKQ